MYFIFFMGKVYHTDFRKNEELVSNVNAVDNYSFFIYSISTNTFLKIQNMKKIENAVLLYVCSRGAYDLFPFIEKLYPYLALATAKASNSVDALKAIPESGLITVLTSNAFYHADANVVGADKNPEKDMTGATLAALIKKKNEDAKVYLHSQDTDISEVFDGCFLRNLENGAPSNNLQVLLTILNDKARAAATSEVQKKIHNDYMKNFRFRKEVTILLSFEEMQEFFKDEELQDQIKVNWQLKFYCKQLFLLSFFKLMKEKKTDEILKIMSELEKTTRLAKTLEARAIVMLLKLMHFKATIDSYILVEIFSGTALYDDQCAQLAYNEYHRRKAGKMD